MTTPLLDSEVLAMLRCPLTGQGLRYASDRESAQFPTPAHAGLITHDGRILYPVENGLPLVVPGEALHLPEGGEATTNQSGFQCQEQGEQPTS